MAVLLFICGNAGVAWGERTIPSGLAALVIATVPLWIAVIDRVVFHHRQPPLVIGGLVLGFVGAAILVQGSISGHVDTTGLLVVIGASIAWASGSLYQRRAPLPRRTFVSAGMQMLVAGVILIVLSAVAGEFGRIDTSTFSRASVLALAYLIVFGSWLGFTSYLWLLRNARTSLVSTYAYVTPVGAVILGAVVLDEAITAQDGRRGAADRRGRRDHHQRGRRGAGRGGASERGVRRRRGAGGGARARGRARGRGRRGRVPARRGRAR